MGGGKLIEANPSRFSNEIWPSIKKPVCVRFTMRPDRPPKRKSHTRRAFPPSFCPSKTTHIRHAPQNAPSKSHTRQPPRQIANRLSRTADRHRSFQLQKTRFKKDAFRETSTTPRTFEPKTHKRPATAFYERLRGILAHPARAGPHIHPSEARMDNSICERSERVSIVL